MNDNLQDERVKQLKDETVLKLSKAFETGVVTSYIWDEFSLWLLLIIGAIFSLIISNIESINNIIGASTISYSFYTLLASGLFGIITRYCFYKKKFYFNIIAIKEEINKNSLAEINSFKEKFIDMTNPCPNFKNYTKFHRWRLERAFEKGRENPLLLYRKTSGHILIGKFFSVAQIIFFVITILIFAMNIKV